jgi:hypothetical protein
MPCEDADAVLLCCVVLLLGPNGVPEDGCVRRGAASRLSGGRGAEQDRPQVVQGRAGAAALGDVVVHASAPDESAQSVPEELDGGEVGGDEEEMPRDEGA